MFKYSSYASRHSFASLLFLRDWRFSLRLCPLSVGKFYYCFRVRVFLSNCATSEDRYPFPVKGNGGKFHPLLMGYFSDFREVTVHARTRQTTLTRMTLQPRQNAEQLFATLSGPFSCCMLFPSRLTFCCNRFSSISESISLFGSNAPQTVRLTFKGAPFPELCLRKTPFGAFKRLLDRFCMDCCVCSKTPLQTSWYVPQVTHGGMPFRRNRRFRSQPTSITWEFLSHGGAHLCTWVIAHCKRYPTYGL